MKILVIAPHADDEIIGCGGYLAKLMSEGKNVDVAYLTTPSRIRRSETDAVQKFMGFARTFFLNQGPGRSLQNSSELTRDMLKVMRASSPNVLLFPHGCEIDKDHKFAYDLARECSYLCESDFQLTPSQKPVSIDILLGYEVWTPIADPQLGIDISQFMEKKRTAMRMYSSQLHQKNFIRMFEGLNQYRGITSGQGDYVEAFMIYKLKEGVLK
ncbi:PIG-L family deacetylase [Candidatus Woesearchaeota archaeon]|nr:PIG-L family deacetylase [Candidatus Woesearchaeota archaeon]